MASHPYRQKAATAPYPVDDIEPESPIQNPNSEGYATPLEQASNSPGYPSHTPASPPPIFASPTTAAAAGMDLSQTPLSATSSLTNLALNPNPNASDRPAVTPPRLTESESNLVPSPSPRWGHNRSVSSTSSFFYDRENLSVVDLDNNLIRQYLGNNNSSLVPRFKTIELYRQNAKKTNDPTVLFQYAQYMLQTALMMESNAGANSPGVTPSQSGETSPYRGPAAATESESRFRLNHSKTRSLSSDLTKANSDSGVVDEKKMRRAILREAHFYLKKLADKGYAEAQYLLADAFSSGAFGKPENKEAFSLFQSAAKKGHVESAYRTSHCYEEGLGTGRDARKALDYLKMAASRNHTAAMYKLGVYMFHGRMGLGQDDNTKKMGIKWLTRAATAATELTAAAPYELGKIYLEGFKDIVIVDRKYALELYSQAAAFGHIQLAAALGHFYEVGDTVPQDANLSIHYYTQAALGGDPASMLAMGAWYLVGSDPYLPKDESEAFEWVKRAAACGLPKAEFAMANFYDKGMGCIKNDAEAQTWYLRAAEHGEAKAVSRIHDKQVAAKLQKKIKKSSGLAEKDCVIM